MQWRVVVTFDTGQSVIGKFYDTDDPQADDVSLQGMQRIFADLDDVSLLKLPTPSGLVFIPGPMLRRSFIEIEEA